MDTNIGAIILAAGFSERMEFPKLLLRYDKNRTFLDKIISEYTAFGCNEIVIVVNEQISRNHRILEIGTSSEAIRSEAIRIVVNQNPERGRFSSLKIGAEALDSSRYCFVQNSDNPFVTLDLLKQLADNKIESGYASPAFGGRGGHPILIGGDVIGRIRTEPKDDRRLNAFLGGFVRINVEAGDDSILLNINTPKEYRRYFDFEIEN